MPPSAEQATRRTQKERVEESNRRLLRAAAQLIVECGVERAAVAEIGRRAGYSHAMVNNRFGSKEALLTALFAEEGRERLMTSGVEPSNGLEGVLAEVDRLIALSEDDPLLFRALIVLAFEMRHPSGDQGPRHQEWLESYTDRLIKNITDGQNDGSIRAHLDPRAEADNLVTHILGLCFRWSFDGEGFPMVKALNALRDQLRARYAPGAE